ncbi:BSD domain-containing protein C22A12.14c [Tolypocladium paradoxum]|uniref:BSD domain-containing protein C22A12.14c n=1 Tax=Tolypocladium paradoxum TaxID=94208 RepID=A0A2S4KYF0_9HYPO|nr:BSD domain-containing protein C22A12.14c [Tolypocladium paradoxum]
MDLAYDHIQEEAFAKDRGDAGDTPTPEQQSSLNSDIQDAYKAISSSAWGVKIGGFLGNVVKQGESVYTQAQKELAEVGEDATKGFTDLRESIMSRTRSLSLNTAQGEASGDGDDTQSTPTKSAAPASEDAAQQSETVLSRLRSEAAKRLKDLQKAEDAADEALLRFGGNVRDFLREAISIAPPEDSAQGGTVLFESKDAQGKRVIHTSRFDAQLHVIHTSTESFAKDPSGDEFDKWAEDFDIEKKTEDISSDLAKYPDLRATMERLVPDQVPYADFWKRYYFLRHGIETAESRRRDLLKAASAEDDVAWDDSDDEADKDRETSTQKGTSVASSTTLHPQGTGPAKPSEPRKSNDGQSQPDSEASYDVVGAASGKTSQAPNSPKESKRDEDSDDDWE